MSASWIYSGISLLFLIVLFNTMTRFMNSGELSEMTVPRVNDKNLFTKNGTVFKVQRPSGRTQGKFLGTGDLAEFILNGDIPTAQRKLHRLLTNVTYNCQERKMFGHKVYGGYDVCLDKRYRPKKNNCLIYSFGINHEFSFDDALNNAFHCEVHSFDPSMKQGDHIHREPNMYFHNLGLWGSDIKQGTWQLNRLQTIMKRLNHENIQLSIYYRVDVYTSVMDDIIT